MKILAAILMVIGIMSTAHAESLVVDTFRGNDFNEKWWQFDEIKFTETANGLKITGSAKDWYIGGCGTYLAKDLTGNKNLLITIHGTQKKGMIKIELYDDDKKSASVDQDKNWIPLYDDKWVYEQKIDWSGWKTITIPLKDFRLDNPGRGDGIFNPSCADGYFGLIQLQLIIVANEQTGSTQFSIKDLIIE